MPQYTFYTGDYAPSKVFLSDEDAASQYAAGCDDNGRTWFEDGAHQWVPGIGKQRKFKVASVSSNTGSFGHSGIILIARDGTAFEVHYIQGGGNRVLSKGDIFPVTEDENSKGEPVFQWARHGVEVPRELPKAPANVLREVWSADDIHVPGVDDCDYLYELSSRSGLSTVSIRVQELYDKFYAQASIDTNEGANFCDDLGKPVGPFDTKEEAAREWIDTAKGWFRDNGLKFVYGDEDTRKIATKKSFKK